MKRDLFTDRIKKHLPADLHDLIKKNGVYMVGGCIRDLLLGRCPADYDLVTEQVAKRFASELSSRLGGKMVELGQPGQPLYRVVSPVIAMDVSPLSGTCIKEDLAKRDFSINAMAWEWASGHLFTVENSIRDLEQKTLRMVSSLAFSDDPVRLVRAYRIATELDFIIEPRTREVIRRQAPAIGSVPGERIRTELVRWLRNPHTHKSQYQMMSDNLLEALFPHLGRSAPGYSLTQTNASNMIRTIEATGRLESLMANSNSFSPPMADLYPDFPDPDQNAYLKMALFFSGVDKSTAREKLKILRFSNQERETICRYLQGHGHLKNLYRKWRIDQLSKESMAEFFIFAHGQTPYILLYFLAEAMVGHDRPGYLHGQYPAVLFFRLMFEAFSTTFWLKLNQPPLISGKELMDFLQLAPSSTIGALSKVLRVAQVAGQITTRKGALQKARQHLLTMCGQPDKGQ